MCRGFRIVRDKVATLLPALPAIVTAPSRPSLICGEELPIDVQSLDVNFCVYHLASGREPVLVDLVSIVYSRSF